MVQEIYLIDNDHELEEKLKNRFQKEKDYRITKVETKDLSIALKNIPAIIIVNEDSIKSNSIELCRTIKSDEDNSITPIILITSNKEHAHKLEMLALGVAHYIRHPIDEEYLYYTIQNVLNF